MKRFLFIVLILVLPTIGNADSQITIDGKRSEGHIIEDNGVPMEQRLYLDFTNNMNCTDGTDATECGVSGSPDFSGTITVGSTIYVDNIATEDSVEITIHDPVVMEDSLDVDHINEYTLGHGVAVGSTVYIATGSTLYTDSISPKTTGGVVAFGSSASFLGDGSPSQFTTGISNYANETVAGYISAGSSVFTPKEVIGNPTQPNSFKTNIFTDSGGLGNTWITNSGSGLIGLGSSKAGGNQENITLNFETSNELKISSLSGITYSYFNGLDILLDDDKSILFGNYGGTTDATLSWETTGNDNLQLLLVTGSATDSGYFSIIERADVNSANRSPLTTTAHPTMRWYSSNALNPLSYGEIYHDDNRFQIASGSTSIQFQVATGSSMVLDQAGLNVNRVKVTTSTTPNTVANTLWTDGVHVFFNLATGTSKQLD
jgi:hypothetical protein